MEVKFQKPQSRIEENVKLKAETWGIVIIYKIWKDQPWGRRES